MYKDFEFTVVAGVTSASPTENIIGFPICTIDSLAVSFPKGPNREVYVKVFHEVESIFPIDREEWINGEDETVIVNGPWSNWDGLYQLRVLLCAPGARLSHKVIFRFNLSTYRSPSTLATAIDNLAGRVLSWP